MLAQKGRMLSLTLIESKSILKFSIFNLRTIRRNFHSKTETLTINSFDIKLLQFIQMEINLFALISSQIIIINIFGYTNIAE